MIKVGVIGTGSMGRNHVRVYSEIAELTGVADVSPEAVKAIGDQFKTPCFTDYKELLKSDVEALSIAVPTQYHHRTALDAIRAGKHVLVEKPLCSTIEEGEELIRAAEQQGVVLAVGHIERHNPVVRYTKTSLEKNTFGEVITLTSRRVSSFPGRIKDVGVILDMGIHDIDVMRYLSGSEVTSVYTLAGTKNGQGKESYAEILLEFSNGVTGVVEVNWLTPMKVRKLWITGATHYVELDYISQTMQISTSKLMDFDASDLYHIPIEFDIRNVAIKKEEPLKNELQDFLAAASGGGKPLIDGRDGLRTLEVAEAAVRSYKEEKKVGM